MAQTDKEKWDQRYRNKPEQYPAAPVFLQQNWQQLEQGRLLDIASGDGACSLFCAKQAVFDVTAVDVSEQGLKRLQHFAEQEALSIDCVCIDLDEELKLKQLGLFNSITLNYFKPSQSLLKVLIDMLLPNGCIMINTFNLQQHHTLGFAMRFCLEDDEFMQPDPRLKVKLFAQSETAPHVDSYILQRVL